MLSKTKTSWKSDKGLQKALDIKPDHADAYNNIGNALQDQGSWKRP